MAKARRVKARKSATQTITTKTVYVTDHIYRIAPRRRRRYGVNTAIGMKYFLNRQTRRKAMTNENNTMPNTSMNINRFRWISTVFLIV